MRQRKPGFVALERALSKLGIASRTTARKWILEGKVKVNGVCRKDPEFSVFPERAKIEIDGYSQQEVKPRTFLLHKPKGVVTTHSDEKGRTTVFSFLEKEKMHLIAVGRLDFATSGLLLLTNDTKMAAWLTDPSNEVIRTYLVSVRGEVTDAELASLNRGIEDEGDTLKPESVVLRKASGRESHLVVSLAEGKNREIRRMFKSFDHEVTRLKRVSYGALELGELAPGDYREISSEELAKVFPDAPVRK
jgi:23S rRNA pseudouridine2605 synthase